ncbi:lantibiotic dehydratase family protein [Aquimarina sp. W85]|uniref:lantibiotic dehydratase family protein n=1 Tax=Aquimarina rhodophyticola TaxID=3342246 RepID=UPI003671A114
MTSPYLPANEYILRTHNLSSTEVADLTVERIKQLCSTPIVAEAIFLASPDLYQEMKKFLDGKKMKDEERLLQSLLKYLLRMGHRCTPFGLFSGCSLGTIDTQTAIELEPSKNHKRFTRIDMSYICSLVQKLEESHEIRKELSYYPNTSLYPVGSKLRYIEYKYHNTQRRHYTMSISNSEYIELLLQKSQNGASIETLAQFLVEPEISLEDATAFVHELIDNQILISSIAPSVTGENYLSLLITTVPSQEIKDKLIAINNLLLKLDSTGYESSFGYYDELTALLDSFGIVYNKKYLFQTDLLISSKKNTIATSVAKDIQSGVRLLNKLVPYTEDEKLTEFKKRFYAKFEDEKIPLSLALDVETGVGYGFLKEDDYDVSPLLNDLNLSLSSNKQYHKKIKWTPTDEFLNSKLIALGTQALELVLTDQDLEKFEENWENLPPSFTAIVHLLNNESEHPLINMSHVGGPSATYLLGRFTQADQDIDRLLKKITEQEKANNDKLLAEIAHLPENRIGNILNRNHLREYEIPYLTKSTLPKNQQITIDDILVSLEYNRIVLTSKKYGKEILPKMATAHNFSYNSLPIYQFLCDIQTQNLRENLGFDWGNAAIGRNFLPRLRYKNIVLSLATWTLQREEIEQLLIQKDITAWRREKNMPQRIMLKDADNELLIDLDHSLSIKTFFSLIKQRSQVTLVEYLFDEQNASVTRDGEAFCNELFFSFIKQN